MTTEHTPVAWVRQSALDKLEDDMPGVEEVQTLLSVCKSKYYTVPLYSAPTSAAAHDMLAALRDLIEQKKRHPGRVENASHLWDAAYAAIAKAEGRSS